jgi:hypothetical protein
MNLIEADTADKIPSRAHFIHATTLTHQAREMIELNLFCQASCCQNEANAHVNTGITLLITQEIPSFVGTPHKIVYLQEEQSPTIITDMNINLAERDDRIHTLIIEGTQTAETATSQAQKLESTTTESVEKIVNSWVDEIIKGCRKIIEYFNRDYSIDPLTEQSSQLIQRLRTSRAPAAA